MMESEIVYCVTSPEPTTPQGQFAKALAKALDDMPEITQAFVKAETFEILDPLVETELPKTNKGKAAKAALIELRSLFAAIPAPEVPAVEEGAAEASDEADDAILDEAAGEA